MDIFFSILIPVFNQVGLMDHCIETIKNQTYKEFEVILVDDGSTDDSYNMCVGFCQGDDRFKVLRHERNGSLVAARYTGMKYCRGQYVLFVDSDDYLEENALELLHNSLVKNPVDILRFGYIKEFMDNVEGGFGLVPENEEVLPLHTDNPLYAMMTDELVPNVWKNCYSKKVIKKAVEEIQPFYCNMGEDVFWSSVFFTCAESDGILEDCLYHYIIGTGMSTQAKNQSVEKLKMHVDNIKCCIEHMKDYISKYNPKYLDLIDEKAVSMYCFVLIMFMKDENDYRKIVDYLKVFDESGLEMVYDYGCNKALLFKFRFEHKITDEMLDKLGVKYDKFSLK